MILPNSERKSPWFQSFTGRKIHPFELRPEDICIEDIAHHLSLMYRFLGATREPYSVAQHSLYVSDLLPPDLQSWGLLHDAPEMFTGIGDVVRPAKVNLLVFTCEDDKPLDGWTLRSFEDRLMLVVAERFGLKVPTDDRLKKVEWADDAVLATERRDVMPPSDLLWRPLPPPIQRLIVPLDWRVVERIFLDRAAELGIK